MGKTTILFLAGALILGATAFADGAQVTDGVPQSPAETADAPQSVDSELEPAADCGELDAVTDALTEGPRLAAGGFGPHCSQPFTCTYQEGGLGQGCTCTYECSCAYCNGQLTRINCVLVDDGGCFSCPS